MGEQFPLALPQGTILAGRYVIDHALGQGGFGITYMAKEHKTGQKVAVKEFFPDTMATRTQTTVTAFSGERGESFSYGKTCFLQEAETLAKFIGNELHFWTHTYTILRRRISEIICAVSRPMIFRRSLRSCLALMK